MVTTVQIHGIPFGISRDPHLSSFVMITDSVYMKIYIEIKVQLGIICDPNFGDPLEFGFGFPFGGIELGLVIAMANYTGSHHPVLL